jgi:hypothetical protein
MTEREPSHSHLPDACALSSIAFMTSDFALARFCTYFHGA